MTKTGTLLEEITIKTMGYINILGAPNYVTIIDVENARSLSNLGNKETEIAAKPNNTLNFQQQKMSQNVLLYTTTPNYFGIFIF